MEQERGSPYVVRRQLLLGMVAGAAGLATARAASGQGGTASSWPNRPVVYINVFPPGAATDTLSRVYCTKMGELAGQQFVVENRSGAGGTVGQAAIAQAPPDGYTVGLGSIASLAIAPSILPDLSYNPARDFTFVSGLWKVPNLLIVNKDLPVRTLPELVELLKKNPGKYTYGSSGFGTSPHLTMEMFKQRAGLDILHVPYRGGAPAKLDLLAGRVQLMFDNMPTVIASAREGQVKALAVTSAERSSAARDIPTMAEFFPDFEITSWGSLVGPAGIPAPLVERMSSLTKQALQDPGLRRFFEENGATTWWTTPQELAEFRTAQQRLFAEVIRATGAKVQ